MRPQDIVIILKIIATSKTPGAWKNINQAEEPTPSLRLNLIFPEPKNKFIAASLQISEAEVSESLKRSAYAGLIQDVKRKIVDRKALFDFLLYGLKYVFPARPGALVRGIPTAQSASPLDKIIISDEKFVWAYAEGTMRGQSIEPLYPTIPAIVSNDKNLYELLALTDAVRIGSARIVRAAIEQLEKRIA